MVQSSFDKIVEHLECPICREIFYFPVNISCGHTFCSTCLQHLKGSICPVCRRPTSLTQSFPVFPLHSVCELARQSLNIKVPSPQGSKKDADVSRLLRHVGTEYSFEITNDHHSLDVTACGHSFTFTLNVYDDCLEMFVVPKDVQNSLEPINFDFELLAYYPSSSSPQVSILDRFTSNKDAVFSYKEELDLFACKSVEDSYKMKIFIHSFDQTPAIVPEHQYAPSFPFTFPHSSFTIPVTFDVCTKTLGHAAFSEVFVYNNKKWQVVVEIGELGKVYDNNYRTSEDAIYAVLRCISDFAPQEPPLTYDVRYTVTFDTPIMANIEAFETVLFDEEHCETEHKLGAIKKFASALAPSSYVTLDNDCITAKLTVDLSCADTLETPTVARSVATQPFPSSDCTQFSMVIDQSHIPFFGHRMYSAPITVDGVRYQLLVHPGKGLLSSEDVTMLGNRDVGCFIRVCSPKDDEEMLCYEMNFIAYLRNKTTQETEVLVEKYTPYVLGLDRSTWGFPGFMKLSELKEQLQDPNFEIFITVDFNSYDVLPSPTASIPVADDDSTLSLSIDIPACKVGRYLTSPHLFRGHRFCLLVYVSRSSSNKYKIGFFFKYNGLLGTADFNTKFILGNVKDVSKSILKSTHHIFSTDASTWGFPAFLEEVDLFNEENGWIEDGVLKLSAILSV
ncbi:hypothetical protein RCL1_004025 [Eukaryota sp. TZLM3-RCL]